jgi:phosphocarrier protein HPr
MLKKTLVISNNEGLRTRPATALVQTAARFKSQIFIEREDRKINAKSLMGVLSLGLRKGENIEIFVLGDDENEAMEAIVDLAERDFEL